MTRVSELVNASHEQQNLSVYNYLVKERQEDYMRRRDEGIRLNFLSAQVDQLQAQVSQLVAAQSKGQ